MSAQITQLYKVEILTENGIETFMVTAPNKLAFERNTEAMVKLAGMKIWGGVLEAVMVNKSVIEVH